MSWIEGWFLFILVVMVNNSTNINQNHLSLQLNEWCQQFHQYQQKSPLTSNHWMMVNNFTNINKNHLSPNLIEWNCWPSLIELKWEVILVDIGGIVDHHSMRLGERWFLLILVKLLTIIQWFEVRGDFCWYWWNCWHHSMSWGEMWFLLILVELLTITQWVEVWGDFCWYWWWSTIPPISANITSHLNSLSDGQQFHQYQQKSPLTSTHWVMVNNSTNIKSPLTLTHWVMVNNSTNINNNYLSLQLIEWWSTIPPIST